MPTEYNLAADLLNKFHISYELIQAFIITSTCAVTIMISVYVTYLPTITFTFIKQRLILIIVMGPDNLDKICLWTHNKQKFLLGFEPGGRWNKIPLAEIRRELLVGFISLPAPYSASVEMPHKCLKHLKGGIYAI